ncbi:hypothetical protein [Novacetimonas hansenii]|uniref:hypothetical protein n=1 Tax=Novacetimonas hansenii TaxID=436 RepID=UPI0011153F46|nr:hypothetical protein [Novacetimonas hansenii]
MTHFVKRFRRHRLFRSKGGTQKLFFFINDFFKHSLLEVSGKDFQGGFGEGSLQKSHNSRGLLSKQSLHGTMTGGITLMGPETFLPHSF